MSALWIARAPIFFFKKELIPIKLKVVKRQISDNKIHDAEVSEIAENVKKIRPRVDVGTSIRYLKSDAYKVTYGDKPVWHIYVRNFKGGYPPRTRKSCIYQNKITTGSPCPICRDEFLVVHYRNIELIKQFISPYGGNIIESL